MTENASCGETRSIDDVVLLPVHKNAHSVTLQPGTHLAGIRFHPGIGYGVLGACFDQPGRMNDCLLTPQLRAIFHMLKQTTGHYARITALYKWLNEVVDFSNVIPASLLQALHLLHKSASVDHLCEKIPISQRQLERQFRNRLGMTPKEFQRILRVKSTLKSIKENPHTALADVALNNGFADQAHMTREFRQIAKITPKQYSKIAANRYDSPS